MRLNVGTTDRILRVVGGVALILIGFLALAGTARVVASLIGVVLLGLVAWLAALRSVRPLADALRMQRNFVSDASHELRTPLTALSSRIQILQRRHERGEPIDVVVMVDSALDELIKGGQVSQASKVVLAKSIVGMAVKKGNTGLLKELNSALTKSLSDGSYARVSGKYFGQDVRCRN